MRVLIAPDKFKGSLTAGQVCEAVERGIRRALEKSEPVSFPLADGGDGTAEILTRYSGGQSVKVPSRDPLMRPVEASYGISPDHQTAFIEMANASGLRLLSAGERNAMDTTSVGTGDLIKDALEKGVSRIIIGIGGSATNDGAIGAASVLGYGFLDQRGNEIRPTGANLINIQHIRTSGVHPRLKETIFIAVCDVDNPLTGPKGAAVTYGPQKGANADQVRQLDRGLSHLSDLLISQLGVDVSLVPGAGGGGGFGGGAMAFFNARLKPGVDVIFEYSGFEQQASQADVIITGEGKMDGQTLHGKVVSGVVAIARKYHKPVIAVTGTNQLTRDQERMLGLDASFALTDYADEQTAINQADKLLAEVAEKEISEFLRRLVNR